MYRSQKKHNFQQFFKRRIHKTEMFWYIERI